MRWPTGFLSRDEDGKVKRFPTGKINPTEIDKGDGFTVETAGGGGFWSPLERPAERVLADVRSGYVSLEAARRDYGCGDSAAGTPLRARRRSDCGAAAKPQPRETRILPQRTQRAQKNKLTTEGTKSTKFKITSVTNSSLCSMCPLRLNLFFSWRSLRLCARRGDL